MDILKCKKVKTRKAHKCFGCNRKFEKGTELLNTISVDNGDIYSTYLCGTCQDYWDKNMQYGDEISQGDLINEDFEEWEKIRLKNEGDIL